MVTKALLSSFLGFLGLEDFGCFFLGVGLLTRPLIASRLRLFIISFLLFYITLLGYLVLA